MSEPTQTMQLIYEQSQPVMMLSTARIRVVSGPDAGKECSLELKRIRVGTDSNNDLVLTDPRVSRQHVEIQVKDQGYRVVDLRSTNGTFYRGARIREVLLQGEAELTIGASVLRVTAGPQRRVEVCPVESFGRLIGAAAKMQELYGLLATVAPSDVTVLIEGETGSGKELVAEEIHRNSPRRDNVFCVVDCGSLVANLVESEIFGHSRGAFTGALGDRKGVFERANGGTVFLDEIGELPVELQTRLLRVLDRRTVRRLGGDTDIKVDVRVVAATNRNLAEEMRKGTFRSDLYYRLAVVRMLVPPLRERPGDILLLARHFLWELGCTDPEVVLSPRVVESLTHRDWPGNVRELRNVLQRATVLSDEHATLLESNELETKGLHAEPTPDQEDPLSWLTRSMPGALLQTKYAEAREQLLETFDRAYLQNLMKGPDTSISGLARQAGVDRYVIRRLMSKLPKDSS